ncbi:MAG TPA: hypothetical protein VFC19_31760 [Candidatus Limnocylindrales bacterium]|nr:hypothetical protein [Candidatus Limnocylindrales bacterium]
MKQLHSIAYAVLGVIVALTTTAAPAHANPTPTAAHGPLSTGDHDTARPQSGHGIGWYGVWATNVNVRQNNSACAYYPSTTNCPVILTTVSAPEQVYVYCQKAGQTIVINPYWVYVYAHGYIGWMASYYIDNATNWIDGVPYC